MARRRVIALTSPKDRQFRNYVLPYLRKEEATVILVDPWLVMSRRVTFEPGKRGLQVRFGSRILTAELDTASVYFGKPRSPMTAPVPAGHPAAHVREQLKLAWHDMLVALDQPYWVSHYLDIRRASSKPLQLQTAAGLRTVVRVPEWTLSSNDGRSAKFIRRQWAERGVCLAKPIESGGDLEGPAYVSRPTLLRPGDTDPGIDTAYAPKILEQYIPGREVTVQVMGEDVFAVEYVMKDGSPLPADVADLHLLATRIRVIYHELPPEAEQFCHDLAVTLDLQAGRIDFKLGPDGNYYFLEINPVGMWDYIQLYTGQPVGQSLASMLLTGSS
jgi:hypothetical protein